jgi:Lrp/AsnC family leucine-responsive transcriptional regulator
MAAMTSGTESADVDDVDRQIIDLLLGNARATATELAVAVSLSPTAVMRRLRRLENSGVITGYSVQVDWGKLGQSIEALIEVRFAGKTRPSAMEDVTSAVPEMLATLTLAGHYDVAMWVRVRDVAHLKQVIDTLRTIGNVSDTRSHIVLASHVARHVAI